MAEYAGKERRTAGTEGAQEGAGERRVPIKWVGAEESPLIFSNSMLVQHTEHEFILTFAQVQPPVPGAGGHEELAKIRFVPARVAVRVVLPPTRMEELIQILQQNYQKFLRRVGAVEGELPERNEEATSE